MPLRRVEVRAEVLLARRRQGRGVHHCGVHHWPALLALPGCLGFLVSPVAQAQALNASALTWVPTVSVSQTVTDNYRPGLTAREADAITQVSGGIRLSSRSRRFNGSVDASLMEILFARHGSENALHKALNALFHSEIVDDHGFVDLSANVSRQNISALGNVTSDPALVNRNTTEVRSYLLAPSWRGRLAGDIRYDIGLRQGASHTSSSGAANSSNSGASVRASHDGRSRFGWTVLADHSNLGYSTSRSTSTDRLVGTGTANLPEADLKLSLSAGREFSNLSTAQRQASTTWGLGAEWTPSNRTHLNAAYDHRPFGHTHQFSFEHRMQRSILRLSSGRSVNTGTQANNAGVGTVYDLLFAQFASIEPDPAKRALLVTSFLQQNGISPDSPIPAAFQTAAASQVDRNELSLAVEGVRDTITGSIFRANTSRIDKAATVNDDLANGQRIVQSGLTLNLAHRLTPESSLNLLGTVSNSRGSLVAQSTRLRSMSLQWIGRTGRYASVSATLRHTDSQAAMSYSENAAIATLNVLF